MPTQTNQESIVFVHRNGQQVQVTHAELVELFPCLGESERAMTKEDLHQINLEYMDPDALTAQEAIWDAEDAKTGEA